MKKHLRLFILGVYTLSMFNLAAAPAITFAAVESCDLIPNSHQVGTQCLCDQGYTARGGQCVPFTCEWIPNSRPVGDECVCDDGYAAKNGQCVPFTCEDHPNSHVEGRQCICDDGYAVKNGQCVPFTCEDHPNSHPVNRQCICDDYFKAKNGQCVPMSDEEVCPKPNSHRVGDKCLCDEGYGSVNGVCTSKASICEKNNATYDASIDDCKCNAGYVMNASGDACNPVEGTSSPSSSASTAAATQTTIPVPNPTSLVPAPGSEPSTPSTSSPTTPPPPEDPLKILKQLNDANSDNKINVEDAIKAALQNATKTESDLVKKQADAMNNLMNTTEGELRLSSSADDNLTAAKSAVVQSALQDEKKWEDDVKKAESGGILKDESNRKTYDDLKNKEQALLNNYKQNQDALMNMSKQTFQILTLTQIPNTLPNSEMIFKQDPNVPQRDFIKENNGDLKGALASNAEATAAQMTLLKQIKDEIRQVNEQKQALLNVPPKPDTEAKLNTVGDKMGWQKNWYK